ncbi:Kinesin-like protein KIF21B [Holothuria leucospilota]|uniref:Kinesin-like protein KIF21B n=1 Tax=Holothuria leucospilota TaxID=206669 RepID=A0A9Q1CT64_HOLLE|nr:Kinesin-like protein KIF21B [Holothuria leucospilota]
MLQTESERMRQRIKAMQETIDAQSERIAILLTQQARLGLDKDIGSEKGDDDSNLTNMMQGYIAEIENLRAKLVESESINSSLRRQTTESSPIRASSRATLSPTHIPLSARSVGFGYETEYADDVRVASVLSEAKKQVEHDQEKLTEVRARRSSIKDSDDDSSLSKDVEPTNNVEAEAESKGEEKEDGKEEEGIRDSEEMGEAEEDEDDDDEDEDDDDESSSSDSDEEGEDGEMKLQEELAEIACEINIKQRLIEELETSQRRLQTMKAQYEQKLESLQNRIKETENERDKVLANLGE